MKKKIAILGSTGSIGKTLIEIIKKDQKNFDIVLLTAEKNYKEIYHQAKILNVKNLIITKEKSFNELKKKKLHKNKIYNNTKKIAIANKEAIICGWHLIKNNLKRYKTKFTPVDSEHFSIFYSLQGNKISNIEKIYLTASGGPLNNIPKEKFKNIKISQAIKHPNWKMGKKISIDSATMMNKVFEIIEAKKIFDLNYDKLDILVHPTSYVHAIAKFKDGMINIVAHDTNMKIPIFNSLYDNKQKNIQVDQLNLNKLNFLDFKKVDKNKFPSIKNIKKLLQKLINMKEIINISKNKPGSIQSIISLNKLVRKKICQIIK